MADDSPLRSDALDVPHGFLGAAASEAGQFAEAIGEAPPVFVRQVHSAKALAMSEPACKDDLPEADALATATPGIALGIVTADCAPVLLADRRAGVIGAAHAGWRGAHGGVLEAVVHAMTGLGASADGIVAAIGPAIAQKSYEVDEGFRAQFAEDDARFFSPGKPGHWQFDLEGYVSRRLFRAGVGTVDRLSTDTYANPALYHSYRRATHRGEPTYGRQFSLIALPS